jgi:cell division septation protein DedD
MIRQKKAELAAQSSGKGGPSPELGFYEALKSSKKTEPFKSFSQASIKPKKVSKPAAKPKNEKPPQPAARHVAQKGRFTIQVAASKDAKSAETLVNTLRSKGFKAYQIRNEVAGKGVWYRVRVGAYQDQEAAGKVLSKLKAGNYKGMIVSTK